VAKRWEDTIRILNPQMMSGKDAGAIGAPLHAKAINGVIWMMKGRTTERTATITAPLRA
jgi:hypothetical protein